MDKEIYENKKRKEGKKCGEKGKKKRNISLYMCCMYTLRWQEGKIKCCILIGYSCLIFMSGVLEEQVFSKSSKILMP